eukprot:865387-Pelagomonas_calceolata.AAC.1
MLDENVSPAADQPDFQAVGQPLQSSLNLARFLACFPASSVFQLCPLSVHLLLPLSGAVFWRPRRPDFVLVCPPCNWNSPIERAGREHFMIVHFIEA